MASESSIAFSNPAPDYLAITIRRDGVGYRSEAMSVGRLIRESGLTQGDAVVKLFVALGYSNSVPRSIEIEVQA